jgi:hypothetical protein
MTTKKRASSTGKLEKIPRLKHTLHVTERNGFFLLQINYGEHPYRALCLIKDAWHPDQVARSLRELADRLDALDLPKGIPPRKGKK